MTPTHAWKGQVRSLDLHTPQAIMKHPNILTPQSPIPQSHWCHVRESQVEGQDLYPTAEL